jgi:hypothetical protein
MPTGAVVSSPALADVDDDGDLEIVVGCADGLVYGLHHDGSTVEGFPISVGAGISSSPAVGDIDLDGSIELVVGAQADSLYVWDLGSRYVAYLTPWPMFHHDARHTGRLPLGTVAVEDETRGTRLRTAEAASLVCGVLFLEGGRMRDEGGAGLLDACGRRVMELRPGPNDIRYVAPGVYFVRRPMTEDGRPRTTVRKVVIQR